MVLTAGLLRKSSGGAGAGEPTFGGSDTSQVFEDFESYTNLANLQATWTPAPEAGAVQSFITTGGHSGSKCWRITHNTRGSPSDTDTLIGRAISDAGAEPQYSAFEFWLRPMSGYAWNRDNGEGSGEKTIIFNQGASDRPRMVLGGYPLLGIVESQWGAAYLDTLSPTHLGLLFSFDGSYVTGNLGTYWYAQNENGATRDIGSYMNDGSYHLIRGKLTPGSFITGASGDGKIEIWVDNTRIMLYDGADSGRAEFGKVLVPIGGPCINNIDLGGPFNSGPSVAQGAQWKEYDDVRVWFRP